MGHAVYRVLPADERVAWHRVRFLPAHLVGGVVGGVRAAGAVLAECAVGGHERPAEGGDGNRQGLAVVAAAQVDAGQHVVLGLVAASRSAAACSTSVAVVIVRVWILVLNGSVCSNSMVMAETLVCGQGPRGWEDGGGPPGRSVEL